MSEFEQIPFGAAEFADNPEPRCPCLLLLDTSVSMRGRPIDELNAGLIAFRAGCEWKSAIECSRFDEFKDQATGAVLPHLLASRSTSFAV